MFLCPGPTVGFGVQIFVSGLYKFMGELADKIFFGAQGHGGWVWRAVLCIWPACISL